MLLSAMIQQVKEHFAAFGQMFLSFFSLAEMLGLSSRRRSFREGERLFAKMWGGLFFLLIVFFLDTGFAEVGGKDLTELFLIGSSFISNDPDQPGSGRVCINLRSDTFVSPFSTKDAIASRVVVAQPITTGSDSLGRSYTYDIVTCSKPTDPGALLGTDHSN